MRKTEIAGAKFPLINLFRFSFHTTFVHHTFLHEMKREARRLDNNNKGSGNGHSSKEEEGGGKSKKGKKSARQSSIIAKGEEIHFVLTKSELDAMCSGGVTSRMIPDDLKVTCIFVEESKRESSGLVKISEALGMEGLGGSDVHKALFLGGKDEGSRQLSASRIQKVALSRPNNHNNFNNFKTFQTSVHNKPQQQPQQNNKNNRRAAPPFERKAMSERLVSAHRMRGKTMTSVGSDALKVQPGGKPLNTSARASPEEAVLSRKLSDGALDRTMRGGGGIEFAIGQSRSSQKTPTRTRRVYMATVCTA